MSRTRNYRRDVRNRKIEHRKRLCRELYTFVDKGKVVEGSWYKHDGQYSKGKIHCSCAMCTYSKKYDLKPFYKMKDEEYVKIVMKDANTEES